MKHRLEHLDRIAREYECVKTSLSERDRRLWAAQQAETIGYGGAVLVCQATGLSYSTVHKGLKELQHPSGHLSGRERKPGGGRKKTTQKLPHIEEAITSLMKPDYQSSTNTSFLWTMHDLTLLTKRLALKGFHISNRNLSLLLHQQNYHLRPSQRPGRYPSTKDRDAQCKRIGMMAQKCVEAQLPLLFVDVRELQEASPILLLHMPASPCLFPSDLGDVSHDKGWEFVGIRNDNTTFVLQTLQTWWQDIGKGSYPNANHLSLVINGCIKDENTEASWIQALQQLANDSRVFLRIRHLPPCTFRWNNILHKTTTYGLCDSKIVAVTLYAIGLSGQPPVSSSFWDTRNPPSLLPPNTFSIKRDKFHPEWNYVVKIK